MLIQANAKQLPLRSGSVHCVVTSPPYFGLRDYGTAKWEGGDPECDHAPEKRGSRFSSPVSATQARNTGSATAARRNCSCGAQRVDLQIGIEAAPDCLGWATGARCGSCYVCSLVEVFWEVKRVLRDDGTAWLNLGDSYFGGGGFSAGAPSTATSKSGRYGSQGALIAGHTRGASQVGLKTKDLVGIPWRVALALQADGWYLRRDVIWYAPNKMPESVTDRPAIAHEYVFLLSKSERYFYDDVAIQMPASEGMIAEVAQGYDGLPLKDYDGAGVQNPSSVKARIIANARRKQTQGYAQAGDHRDNPGGGYKSAHMVGTSRNDGDRWRLADGGVAPRTGTVNKRTVWTIPTRPYTDAHFATFPPELPATCILAGTSAYGCCPGCGAPWERTDYAQRWQPTCTCGRQSVVPATVLDPFIGSGTVGEVAERLGRRWVGTDLNYQKQAAVRTAQRGFMFAEAQ